MYRIAYELFRGYRCAFWIYFGKYDFLVKEGFTLVPADQAEHFRNKAKAEYMYELNDMVHSGSVVEGKTAAQLLVKLQKGEITYEQSKYIADKAKIVALKAFMYNAKELKFAENG